MLHIVARARLILETSTLRRRIGLVAETLIEPMSDHLDQQVMKLGPSAHPSNTRSEITANITNYNSGPFLAICNRCGRLAFLEDRISFTSCFFATPKRLVADSTFLQTSRSPFLLYPYYALNYGLLAWVLWGASRAALGYKAPWGK